MVSKVYIPGYFTISARYSLSGNKDSSTRVGRPSSGPLRKEVQRRNQTREKEEG